MPRSNRESAPRWRAVAAVTTGRKHRAQGRKGQDAAAVLRRGQRQVLVLCDGAGSAGAGGDGARELVRSLSRWLLRRLPLLAASTPEQAAAAVLRESRRCLHRLARRQRLPLAEVATTLLFAAFDRRHGVIGQLGDGSIAVLRRDEPRWQRLPLDTRGEHASETCFVTSADAAAHLRLLCLGQGELEACLLMSDGAESALVRRGDGSLAPAADTLAQWLAEQPLPRARAAVRRALEEALLPRTWDDLGLALAVRR